MFAQRQVRAEEDGQLVGGLINGSGANNVE